MTNSKSRSSAMLDVRVYLNPARERPDEIVDHGDEEEEYPR